MKYLLVILLALPLSGCSALSSGMCGNSVIQEIPSPDGKSKVVIFERDCGATTSFSTQVSILSVHSSLRDESGNIFVVDDGDDKTTLTGRGAGPNVWAKWIASNRIKIVYDRGARTFAMKKQYQGILIVYRPK